MATTAARRSCSSRRRPTRRRRSSVSTISVALALEVFSRRRSVRSSSSPPAVTRTTSSEKPDEDRPHPRVEESQLGDGMAGRETLVGSSPWTLRRRHGVQLHGRAVDAGDATVRFADRGALALEVGTVIWATGFRTDHAWIDVPTGRPVHERGVTGWPGLCLLRLTWQHTRGSALPGLGERRRRVPRSPDRRRRLRSTLTAAHEVAASRSSATVTSRTRPEKLLRRTSKCAERQTGIASRRRELLNLLNPPGPASRPRQA
jgi:hypothetical protein